MVSSTIHTVHVVFKTHLDIGFTLPSAQVVDAYLSSYIPKAIALARSLRAAGGTERFVWTTGSWLIHEALERSAGEGRRDLEQALADGDLAWHALPFTTHTEYADAGLIRHGLSLSRCLDQRFGRTTRAAKMTDVPGHTVALVPLLAEAGIEMLHLGVNPASAVPDVPDLFRWRMGQDEVMVLYDGSYGGSRTLPGGREALVFGHTGDNHGPQTAAEVVAQFATVAAAHPDAAVRAARLDDVLPSLRNGRAAMPVVEDEIGDTWIHGVGTDPHKTRRFRALLRWRAETIASNPSLAARRDLARFSDDLLLVAEHTWGRDNKRIVIGPDGQSWHGVIDHPWETTAFQQARADGAFDAWEDSWYEQRAYLDSALDRLAASSLHAQALSAQAEPQDETIAWVDGVDADSGEVQATLDPHSGGLSRLVVHGRAWVSATRPFGTLSYLQHGAAEYQAFMRWYNPDMAGTSHWSIPDFSKPGMEAILPVGATHAPRVVRVQRADNALRAELAFDGAATGAPRRVTCTWWLHARGIRLTLRWSAKPACRLAESLWVGLPLAETGSAGYQLRKLGREVDPARVVRRGGRHLHAVEGLVYRDARGSCTIDALDSALVAPGKPRLLAASDELPDPAAEGMHACLWNNVWGTNFPMWYEEDAVFRFDLTFADPA